MKYMLDTNVLVHLIRNKSENIKNRLRQENISDVCISSITYAELEYGVSKSSNKEKNALAEGLTLVTNNTREFRRVPGLNIEDWTDSV